MPSGSAINAPSMAPATCWHLVTHPKKDLFYPVTFRVLPQEYIDYHEWAMAYLKEYVFEIDVESKQVVRHWACSRGTASQSIIFIDLESFSSFRILDEKPDISELAGRPREVATQVYDVCARGGIFNSSRHIIGSLRVSRFSLLDSIYGCQLSQDQSLLFTANRGLNHITIYDYPINTQRLRVKMPDIQNYVSHIGQMADPRLGFHHGYLLSPPVVTP